MRRFRAARTLGLVTAVVAVAGCGDSSKAAPKPARPTPSVSGGQREILSTVDALQTASRKGDGRTICEDIFSPKLVRSVEKSAKRSCAKEVSKRLFTSNAEFTISREIKLAGARGTAFVREQNGNVSRLSLVKRDGDWRIDRVTPEKSK